MSDEVGYIDIIMHPGIFTSLISLWSVVCILVVLNGLFRSNGLGAEADLVLGFMFVVALSLSTIGVYYIKKKARRL